MAGLRSTGLIAPVVLDGPMTGEVSRAYVEQMRAPAPEAGVVMDNRPAHKVTGVREAIQSARASLLYLPASSPDRNPIERVCAKVQALLGKAAARTKDALWGTIGSPLDGFTPEACTNHLANRGYEPD